MDATTTPGPDGITPEQLAFKVDGYALFCLMLRWQETVTYLRDREAKAKLDPLLKDTVAPDAAGLAALAVEECIEGLHTVLAASVPSDTVGRS